MRLGIFLIRIEPYPLVGAYILFAWDFRPRVRKDFPTNTTFVLAYSILK